MVKGCLIGESLVSFLFLQVNPEEKEYSFVVVSSCLLVSFVVSSCLLVSFVVISSFFLFFCCFKLFACLFCCCFKLFACLFCCFKLFFCCFKLFVCCCFKLFACLCFVVVCVYIVVEQWQTITTTTVYLQSPTRSFWHSGLSNTFSNFFFLKKI